MHLQMKCRSGRYWLLRCTLLVSELCTFRKYFKLKWHFTPTKHSDPVFTKLQNNISFFFHSQFFFPVAMLISAPVTSSEVKCMRLLFRLLWFFIIHIVHYVYEHQYFITFLGQLFDGFWQIQNQNRRIFTRQSDACNKF